MASGEDTLGVRLKSLRKEKRETQVAVAAAVGISRSHLANIERDRDNPGWGTALALASYYQCSLDWLTSMADQIKPGSAAAANNDEAMLLYLFRSLPKDEAQAILSLLYGRVRPRNNG